MPVCIFVCSISKFNCSSAALNMKNLGGSSKFCRRVIIFCHTMYGKNIPFPDARILWKFRTTPNASASRKGSRFAYFGVDAEGLKFMGATPRSLQVSRLFFEVAWKIKTKNAILDNKRPENIFAIEFYIHWSRISTNVIDNSIFQMQKKKTLQRIMQIFNSELRIFPSTILHRYSILTIY